MFIRQRTFFTALNHIQRKQQQGFLKNLFSSVTFSANTKKSLISSSTSISFNRNLSEQRRQSFLSLLKKNKNYSTSSPVMTASGKEIRESFPADKEFLGTDVEGAMEALAKADAVCFDVDSTVITEEGIDVLAEYLGKGKEVSEFTAKAMGGTMKFEDALEARLKIIEPSKQSILNCLNDLPLELSPKIDEFIELCHHKGIDVYLVSGGFRIMIEPIAKELLVAKDNIYANSILFNDDAEGTYAGFDATEPTSADGGKPKALRMIKENAGYETMIMVGDGATDAQAKPPAKAFIGFGGVVTREAVKAKACWFIKDFQDMIHVVDKYAETRRDSSPHF